MSAIRNKTKRSMERDVEKEKTRKKKSQHQQEHLHIWKEKKVKRMEILGTQV